MQALATGGCAAPAAHLWRQQEPRSSFPPQPDGPGMTHGSMGPRAPDNEVGGFGRSSRTFVCADAPGNLILLEPVNCHEVLVQDCVLQL